MEKEAFRIGVKEKEFQMQREETDREMERAADVERVSVRWTSIKRAKH